MGERQNQNQPFQFSFNAALKVDFQGSRVTSDGGLILVRELDEHLGFGELIKQHLADPRGKRTHGCPLLTSCASPCTAVAGELLITPSKRAFWRNGSASLISRMAAIHSDRDARWRPGRPSLPLHRSCRGDREPFGWDRGL